ncbi:sodium:proton antiporter, partial [Photobacterium aphoticum]
MAMLLPAAGMIFGLVTAILFSYRKPREYKETEMTHVDTNTDHIKKKNILFAVAGIVFALSAQLTTGSMIVGGLAGFIAFTFGGVI